MQLLTDALRAQLLANGMRSARGEDIDPYPVVKLFTPDAGATWLLTELDPNDPDLAFAQATANRLRDSGKADEAHYYQGMAAAFLEAWKKVSAE